MAIRRVTGAVSPSELIFADANALGATYDGSGTTIERGETFTLPAGGTTAVSNGALRLEALKGDCTITNNGNSTLTNASGVDGTIVMRSGASDFPAFVRNSSMGSMSTPAREDFTGSLLGAGFPAGHVLQVKSTTKTDSFSTNSQSPIDVTGMNVNITPTSTSSKILVTLALTWGGTYNVYVPAYVLRGSTVITTSTAVSKTNQTRASFGFGGDPDSGFTYKLDSAVFNFLDSPSSTSELTYKLQWNTTNTSHYVYLNRPENDNNDNYNIGGTSSITVMEIAG